MKAPTIFCSAQSSLNVDEIFKIVLCKAFKLKCTIPPVSQAGEAIIEYENPAPAAAAAGPSGSAPPK
jgi:GTP-binding protein of the ras superfamily involved in termination of M-phase